MGQSCTVPKPKKAASRSAETHQKDEILEVKFNPTEPPGQEKNQQDQNKGQFFFETSNTSFPSMMLKNKKIRLDPHLQDDENLSCFITNENIKDVYQITDNLLGKGAFGSVKEAYLLANPLKRFAVKSISKTGGAAEGGKFDWLYREVRIFRQLDHPNIAKLYETYQDSRHFYLVMEICNGGQLLQKVLEQKRFSEQFASQVIAQMLSAVKYLHSMDIVHRDLKPDNFLFSSDMKEIKMIDFGLSKQYNLKENNYENKNTQQMRRISIGISPQNQNMQTIVGTVQYIAPEVLTRKYDFRCDIWSLGVILYCLLSGEFPFSGNNEADIFEKINKGAIIFKDEYHLSKQAKDLIRQLICVDPKKRISIADSLKHPWFKLQNTHQFDSAKILQIRQIKNLQTFPTKLTLFQRLFLHLAFKATAQSPFIEEFVKVFRSIDQNNEGFITAENLHRSMHALGYNETKLEVSQLVQSISSSCFSKKCTSKQNQEEFIEFSLFLELNMDRSILSNEDVQQKVFNMIDIKKKGVIGTQEIQNCLQREGYQNTSLFVQELLTNNNSQSASVTTLQTQHQEISNPADQNKLLGFSNFQKLLSANNQG